ncbi:MAG: glycoside hydrolase family 95 protein [Verrucomicrobiae bacterium]|nr:glycoside hydrolase family 95 protein [Verrucomicrobiae bacterium]NNJ42869.1 glycoside hydrolase family 95 protein [Akkermansiaceae bacterium]
MKFLMIAWLPLTAMAADPSLLLSYDQAPEYRKLERSTQYMDPSVTFPHSDWEREASPIGNGRIGAMVFGDPLRERIQFNDISLWTGGANESGKYSVKEPGGFGSYQNFGDLRIKMNGASTYENYRRTLDLATGIHTTSWTSNGVAFTREVFASHPDESILILIKADKPGRIDATITLAGSHGETTQGATHQIRFSGRLDNDLRYAAALTSMSCGGEVKVEGDQLQVTGDSVLLVLNAATDYAMNPKKKFRSGIDPNQTIDGHAKAAMAKGYDALRQSHVSDFSALMNRVVVNLGKAPDGVAMHQRLERYRQGKEDPHLEMLLFQFGRYLLIASSRHRLPANLQGLWNDMNHPAWYCDYHTNINIQMNYWPTGPANLAECAMPLLNWVDASVPSSRAATTKAFGEGTPGWTMRTSVNIFGGNGWEWNLPSSAWLSRHYWDQYAFTGDKKFLRERAWPIFEDVSKFWLHHLIENEGKLIVHDGWSPEHGPREDGVAHDHQIVWDLFTNTLKAAHVLGIDNAFVDQVRMARKKLMGPELGSWGQIKEWLEERPVLEKSQHRHTSHLYAVYPSEQISLYEDPKLAQAAILSLAARGNAGDSRRSWTWGWRCALWSRLGLSSQASDMIRGQLTWNALPNLLASHPPFQMDGNSGITAGVCEMLVQSHAGEVSLLPAIPIKRKWRSGSFSGLRARGGFEVGASWDKRTITTATIESLHGNPITLRMPLLEKDTLLVTPKAGGNAFSIDRTKDGTFPFPTKAGTTYTISW